MTKGLTAGLSGLNTFLIARNHGLCPWLQYGRPFRPQYVFDCEEPWAVPVATIWPALQAFVDLGFVGDA